MFPYLRHFVELDHHRNPSVDSLSDSLSNGRGRMGRRDKGAGSVYQRSNGRYVGEYTDANGKRRYVSGKNKPDVKAKLKEVLKDKDEGVSTSTLTFGNYLDQWLDSTKDTVGLRTYQRAEIAVRLHVKPTLGVVKLDKLTALQLDALYRDKLKSGLSPRSVQLVHATTHKALKQAYRWRMVRTNVAENATPPRSTSREMQPLTKEQTRILLRTAQHAQPKLYALYTLAATTGARLGELLALQPADVNLEAGTLRISKSIHNGRVSAPKTNASNRTIRLSRVALEAVQTHLTDYTGAVWLFESPTKPDESIQRSTLRLHRWRPLLRAAGLPLETRFHDLRHGVASMLLGERVPVTVVSQLLGHANSAITLKVYAHLLPDHLGTAALAMNGLLEEDATVPVE